MKCPECGDTDRQEPAWRSAYRCQPCGHVYPLPDLATLLDRVEELKAYSDAMLRQHGEFAKRLAEIEAQLRAAQGDLAAS